MCISVGLRRWVSLLLLVGFAASGLGDVLTLKNGLKLEGTLGKISAYGENPLKPGARAGRVATQLIVLVDDDLRRTFVCTYQVQDRKAAPPEAVERIKINQRVADRGPKVVGVNNIVRVTPFDEWGRRIFSMNSMQGRLDVIQGITEITPTWTKVEGLLAGRRFVWDMRIGTDSIPRETLSATLMKQIDRQDPDQRLKIVRLYLQAQRYRDAEEELAQTIADFPELGELKSKIRELRQLKHQQLIDEIDLRRSVGQHHLAYARLHSFPEEGVAGELLLRVRELIEQYDKIRGQGEKTLELLELHQALLDDLATREQVDAVAQEIAEELNIYNLDRMADYLRLADNEELKPDQKLSLAISGWLLGAGAGTENLKVALSLAKVRDLVRQYLTSDRPHQRQEILKKLGELEGGDPANIAKLLAAMMPPKATEPQQNLPLGMFTLTTPGLTGQADITYHVQLPPEYSPYRRYPAVLTLHGAGTTAKDQIDWWAGPYDNEVKMRLGQGARQGYIVIAPEWTKEHQREYGYTAREHAAALFPLRDALQRFSIDTDNVFLTGHSMGGDAAWDIALAHPDLFAGAIPIVATSDKYVQRYWENARHIPLYFVCGELDGDKGSRNQQDFNRYLTKAGFDVVVVEYRGRGHENFSDEIQRIFQWMELQKRNFFPQEFTVSTMRPWDNFFWMIELADLPGRSIVYPAGWPPESGVRPVAAEGRIGPTNRLRLETGAGKVTFYMTPDIVDFDERIELSVNTRTDRELVTPDVETMLEDVRTRGDRQHPFWAKHEMTTGR